MIFIRTFDDYGTPIMPNGFNITQDGIANVANEFLRYIGKIYDIGSDKEYSEKYGTPAWYVEQFYQWAENNHTQCRVIYFPSTEKAKDPHIAILMGDLVLDFTHKKFSKDKKDKFSILPMKDYKKYGYSDRIEVVDEFPDWVEDVKAPKEK